MVSVFFFTALRFVKTHSGFPGSASAFLCLTWESITPLISTLPPSLFLCLFLFPSFSSCLLLTWNSGKRLEKQIKRKLYNLNLCFLSLAPCYLQFDSKFPFFVELFLQRCMPLPLHAFCTVRNPSTSKSRLLSVLPFQIQSYGDRALVPRLFSPSITLRTIKNAHSALGFSLCLHDLLF